MPEIGTSEPTDEKTQLHPHEVYPSWIIFSVFSILLGLALFISTALMLSAVSGKSCSLFTIIPAVFMVFSFGIVLLGAGGLKWKVKRQGGTPESRGSCICRYVGFSLMMLFYAICVLVIIVGASFWAMKRNQAALDFDYKKVPGLNASVSVTRDTAGIPHITAATASDADFAQGFVTAQDRLFQLELWRMITYGRMAEFFGSAALDVDRGTRAMNFKGATDRLFANLSPAEVLKIQRYVDGINYYLDNDGALPPEFMFMAPTLFSYHVPERFTVKDVSAVGVLLMFRINSNAALEATRWELFSKGGMSYEAINDLFVPLKTRANEPILTTADLGLNATMAAEAVTREANSELLERQLYEETMIHFRENVSVAASAAAANGRHQEVQEAAEPIAEKKKNRGRYSNWWLGIDLDLFHEDKDIGSQGWFVRQGGSAKVYGGGDPHLDASVPSFWHPLHLTVGTQNFIGCTVAGIPGIMYGKTDTLAWSITISFGDMQDYYVMVPDPANPNTHYMYNGVSTPYTTRTEVIKVKGGNDHVMTVQDSVLGPVVGEHLDMTTKHKLVFNSTGNMMVPAAGPMLALYESKNVSQAIEHITALASPALSITMGDVNGTLGYACSGLHPIRRSGHTGRWPILGNGSWDYDGYVPANEHPTKIDSNVAANGRVSSANNKIYADGYKYTLGYDFLVDYRFVRLNELLDTALVNVSENVETLAFHEKVQADDKVNWWARAFRPLLVGLGNTWTSRLDAVGLAKWNEMLQWNNRSSLGMAEPAVAQQWLLELNTLPTTALKQLEYEAWTLRQDVGYRLLASPTASLRAACSDAGYASCVDFAAAKWNEVAARADRRWGQDINRLHARHMIFGDSFLSCVFDFQIDKPGEWSALSYSGVPASDIDLKEAFVTATASHRHLYGFGENHTRFNIPGGASGHPFSEYYDNIAPLLSTDEYVNIEVKGGPVAHQQLLSP